MMKKYLCLLALFGLLLPGMAFGSIHTYQLSDHPDGNALPPSYGLRLDNLFKAVGNQFYGNTANALAGITTFSFDATGAGMFAEVDTSNDTLRIFGTAVGGIAPGSTYTHEFTIDLDFTYQLTAGALAGFNQNSPNLAINAGSNFVNAVGTLDVTSSSIAGFVDYLNQQNQLNPMFELSAKADGNNYFNFKDKLLRGGNHGTGIEGEGWLLVDGQMYGTQDWLFTSQLVPEPTAVSIWAGFAMLGGLLIRRRRED